MVYNDKVVITKRSQLTETDVSTQPKEAEVEAAEVDTPVEKEEDNGNGVRKRRGHNSAGDKSDSDTE